MGAVIGRLRPTLTRRSSAFILHREMKLRRQLAKEKKERIHTALKTKLKLQSEPTLAHVCMRAQRYCRLVNPCASNSAVMGSAVNLLAHKYGT
jgi:hypothetical protein